MLVQAFRLRYLGHRILTDVLRNETPMMGDLTYHPHQHGRSMTCLLMPLGGNTEPLVQLYGCKIKIEKRGILIRGEEDVWKRKQRESHIQTVWAWAVPPEARTVHQWQEVFAPGATASSIPKSLSEAVAVLKRYLENAKCDGKPIAELAISENLLMTREGVRWVMPFVLSAESMEAAKRRKALS